MVTTGYACLGVNHIYYLHNLGFGSFDLGNFGLGVRIRGIAREHVVPNIDTVPSIGSLADTIGTR